MKFKKGDYVIFRRFFKRPGFHGMEWNEGLCQVIDSTSHQGYTVWDCLLREVKWVGEGSLLREASSLEVFAYEVNSG